ncbi:HNH endonuclease, partial [Rhodovulum sulfidophilum]|nr:HNH endonuclease [Rhodovulum sulfidophilum]
MAIANKLPPADVLMSMFRYDEGTGALLWRYRPVATFRTLRDAEAWNSRFCNTPAGNFDGRYLRVRIDGRGRFLAHRIIFKMHFGSEPELIDHIDGNTQNNRIDNLRSVGAYDNSRNSCIPKSNLTGARGVRWDKERGRWRAFITVDRKFRHIGNFDDFDAALSARRAAEVEYGFHTNQ